jgi:CheY-like chemotaxis protein
MDFYPSFSLPHHIFIFDHRKSLAMHNKAMEEHPAENLTIDDNALGSTLHPPQTLGGGSLSRIDHSKLKVLIVEDNLVNQRVLQKMLQKQGFKTEIASHGGEALEFLKSSSFWAGQENSGVKLDVVLMDLWMPVVGGIECTRTIRKFQADGTIVSHVPIIVLTPDARSKMLETLWSAGMVL